MKRRSMYLLMAAVLVTTVVFLRRSGPTLYRLEETGCACIVPAAIAIPNPLRDRSAEQPAVALLELLRDDRCELAVELPAGLVEHSSRGDTMDLRDRLEEDGFVRLTYAVDLVGHAETFLLWFRVQWDGRRWQAARVWQRAEHGPGTCDVIYWEFIWRTGLLL